MLLQLAVQLESATGFSSNSTSLLPFFLPSVGSVLHYSYVRTVSYNTLLCNQWR